PAGRLDHHRRGDQAGAARGQRGGDAARAAGAGAHDTATGVVRRKGAPAGAGKDLASRAPRTPSPALPTRGRVPALWFAHDPATHAMVHPPPCGEGWGGGRQAEWPALWHSPPPHPRYSPPLLAVESLPMTQHPAF